MPQDRTERRLAAILAADIVGYTRLMEHDEAGTLAALKQHRKSVLEPLVARHSGRIFKFTGDGVLVEFASAVNAVQCAIGLQNGMADANADLPSERHLVLRIGLALGDILVDGSDLYGEGVNIASRLEGIAEPGGILISGAAFDSVRNKVGAEFEDCGTPALKNISQPVRVFRIAGMREVPETGHKPDRDRPSIAILPFVNMSDDVSQQYFSDGITEDIITELARFRSLFVIARNSSFQYRASNIDIRRVGRELGVQYVVEGSVRRAGERLRITAQLIDAGTGDHIWAERYDRRIEDIFSVQDEVAGTIAATLEGRVAASATEMARRKPTKDLKAYDYFLQGRAREAQYDMAGAEAFYARAGEHDPGYAHAHAFRATALMILQFEHPDPELVERAQACAQLALSIDPHDAWNQHAAGYIALCQGRFDEAGMHLERAIALNPNDMDSAADHASWLARSGEPAEALRRLDIAMKRDPFPATWIWEVRFRALFHLNRFQEAIAALNNVPSTVAWRHVYLASALAHAGRLADAQAEVESLCAKLPTASVRLVAAVERYLKADMLEHLLTGLRQAGLPE